MKKTNFVMASVAFVLFTLLNMPVFAQSTDPDSPTVLTQNVIQGNNLGDHTISYYYTFTAGAGIIKITADAKADAYSSNLGWNLKDSNFNDLGSEYFSTGVEGERKVKEIKLDKNQKVIFKVEVPTNLASFKIQFAGAVDFVNAKNNNAEEIIDITSGNTQKVCFPRNAVLMLMMKDGQKAKIDLSKVQKIDIQ
jgi:hypothetical protein